MTGEDVPLFGGYEPPREDPLSAGRRLTQRQYLDVANGVHPLMRTPLHERADRYARAADLPGQPFTCGSCVHRDTTRGYPKCDLGPVSHGAATDVRSWWPACPKWEEGRA